MAKGQGGRKKGSKNSSIGGYMIRSAEIAAAALR